MLLVSDRTLGRNNVEVCRSTPVADLMANLEAFPIIFDEACSIIRPISTSPDTLRTLSSTLVSGRRPGAGAWSTSISECA